MNRPAVSPKPGPPRMPSDHGGQHSTALYGATRAFRPQAPTPTTTQQRQLSNDGLGANGLSYQSNGALVAATRAGRPAVPRADTNESRGRSSTASSPTRPTSAEYASLKAGRDAMARSVASKSPAASFDRSALADRRKQSPSHIAATLAASRATPSLPPSPRVTDAYGRSRSPKGTRRPLPSPGGDMRPLPSPRTTARHAPAASLPSSPHRAEGKPLGVHHSDAETDTSEILSTKALIASFEKKGESQEGVGQATQNTRAPSSGPRSPTRIIVSPKPIRPSIPLLASKTASIAPGTPEQGRDRSVKPIEAELPRPAQSKAASIKPPPRVPSKAVDVRTSQAAQSGTANFKQPPPSPPKKPASLARIRSKSGPKPAGDTLERRNIPAQEKENKEGSRPATQRRASRASHITTPPKSPSDSDASSGSYASARDVLSRIGTLEMAASPLGIVMSPKELLPSAASPQQAISSRRSLPPLPPPPRRASSNFSHDYLTASRLKPQLTADSLADAIVASSLASSRVGSPTRASLPPSPAWMSQQSRRGSAVTSNSLFPPPAQVSVTRTPSPLKSMRQTLRRDPLAEADDEGRRHRHRWGRPKARSKSQDPFAYDRSKSQDPSLPLPPKPHHHPHARALLMRKHPHKHAEGDRRRWRDKIEEAERKRYEGVWAANRGILCAPDEVHAYVVRDVWSRSRLGTAVLAQVWDLVAGSEPTARPSVDATRSRPSVDGSSEARSRASLDDGSARPQQRRALRRDEFVVGMWLVDQCLRGRRLPPEVSDSVWQSARNLMGGVRVR